MVEKTEEERVKTTTETIEVEQPAITTETVDLYICPNCRQEYEIDEMVNIGLGIREISNTTDSDWYAIHEISMICCNCAELLFDYNHPDGDKNISYTEKSSGTNALNSLNKIVAILTPLIIWLIALVIAVSMSVALLSIILNL